LNAYFVLGPPHVPLYTERALYSLTKTIRITGEKKWHAPPEH
jgi:hypothetical protein